MKYYYEARKNKHNLYRGVVYHYSNIREDEGIVIDYTSKEYSHPSSAVFNAFNWLDDEGLLVDAELR